MESIAATPGIDGLLIGPYDLSGSLGRIGQLDHPDLASSKKQVLETARKAGIGCGLHVVHPTEEVVERALRENYSFLALGVDMILLDQSAKAVLQSASKRK